MTLPFEFLQEKLVFLPVIAYPDFSIPFIVEKGASKVANGAFLAQKKEDGHLNPIQNASRTMNSRNEITAQNDIIHWDLKTITKFVLDRYWCPKAYQHIMDYVKNSEGCQKVATVTTYVTSIRFPLKNIFDTYSIDFAGPLPMSGVKHIY